MIKKHFLLIAVLVLLAGLMIPDKLVWPREKSSRVQWEYKIVRNRTSSEKVLNEYGEDGWEIIDWENPDFLLKRRKDSWTASQSAKEKTVKDSPQKNEDIVKMYQEIIKLRERVVANELRF